jgi:ribosome-associated protein YbcJ (S4-like RNA binding protein)
MNYKKEKSVYLQGNQENYNNQKIYKNLVVKVKKMRYSLRYVYHGQ